MTAPVMLDRLVSNLPLLFQGALVTLSLSAAAIVVGFLLGASLLAMSEKHGQAGVPSSKRQRVMGAAVSIYVSFFRGTPLLVQLLMLFYLPTAFGINLPPFLAAVIAMGMNSAAFQCEILRAGLSAVSPGQVEAAAAFGIPRRYVFRYIQLPQITRAVWPAVISEAVDVLKSSAIVSVIAVTELTRTGRQIVAGNFRPMEVYLTMGGIYLLMTSVIFLLGAWFSQHLKNSRRASNQVMTELPGRVS